MFAVWPLKNSRRSYAVMYDLSGLPAGGCNGSSRDWTHLRHTKHITDDRSLPGTLGKTRRRCLGVSVPLTTTSHGNTHSPSVVN